MVAASDSHGVEERRNSGVDVGTQTGVVDQAVGADRVARHGDSHARSLDHLGTVYVRTVVNDS